MLLTLLYFVTHLWANRSVFFLYFMAALERKKTRNVHTDIISDRSDSPERGTGSARFAGHGRPVVENVVGVVGSTTVQV